MEVAKKLGFLPPSIDEDHPNNNNEEEENEKEREKEMKVKDEVNENNKEKEKEVKEEERDKEKEKEKEEDREEEKESEKEKEKEKEVEEEERDKEKEKEKEKEEREEEKEREKKTEEREKETEKAIAPTCDSADKEPNEITVGVSSLELSKEGNGVDTPSVALKSETLNEEVESDDTFIKTIIAADTPYNSAKTFEELNLSEELLMGLYTEMRFEKPSRIQAITLPMVLTPPYLDLIAQAHNGSGKTTCFICGMLSRVDPKLKAPQALCVCPTRELAIQNEQVLLKMGKYTGITSVCAVSSDSSKYSSSRRGPIVDQIVIGTPGTIKKWITVNKNLNTEYIKILVFDEADHMLAQDGFQDDSLRIMKDITRSRGSCQILLFSATFNEKVKQFVQRVIPKANQVFVKKEELSLDVIKQYRVRCPNDEAKITVLKDRLFPAAEKLGQSIIFVRTRASASLLHRRLEADGHKCTSIQGGLSYEERDAVIREFRSGTTKILISTDVLARGFDQAQVTLVVNYDLPLKSSVPYEPDYELYLHRIGRSGRFGRKGAAFNLIVTDQDERNLNKIEGYFNHPIPEVPWDDDDCFEDVLKSSGLA